MKTVLIGYGYWGRIVKKYIETSQYFELSGIIDPSNQTALSMENILTDSKIESAFVCTPVESHYEVVSKLLKSGKHVFCEKPLCKKEKETDYLIQLAAENGVILHTDYIYTNSPSIREIENHLYDLGSIKHVEMRIRQFGNFYRDDDVIDVLTVHMLSVLGLWFPNHKITVEKVTPNEINLAGLIEDVSIDLRVNDITISITSSLISDQKERRIELVCDEGLMVFDMLGEHTTKIIKHRTDGYKKEAEVLATKHYDEANNLKNAIMEYAEEIQSRKSKNQTITQTVSELIEQIRRKLSVD